MLADNRTCAIRGLLLVRREKQALASDVHFPSEECSCEGRISAKKHSNAYKFCCEYYVPIN